LGRSSHVSLFSQFLICVTCGYTQLNKTWLHKSTFIQVKPLSPLINQGKYLKKKKEKQRNIVHLFTVRIVEEFSKIRLIGWRIPSNLRIVIYRVNDFYTSRKVREIDYNSRLVIKSAIESNLDFE
jgi:hypothetical protein